MPFRAVAIFIAMLLFASPCSASVDALLAHITVVPAPPQFTGPSTIVNQSVEPMPLEPRGSRPTDPGAQGAQQGTPQPVSAQAPAEPQKPGGPTPKALDPGGPKPALPGGVFVVVENHSASRPQSGLDKADIVFEADVVAGITRFLTLFYRNHATEIGPVRSARWVFYHLSRGYGLPFAHCGGNLDLLAEIGREKEHGFPDLDEIRGAGAHFWRNSRRRAPHNLYTSTARLLQGMESRGFPLLAPVEYSTLSDAVLPEGGQRAVSVRVPYRTSSPGANVVTWHFRNGIYVRSTNGTPHRLANGTQIATENVVILYTTTHNTVKFGEPIKENDIVGEGDCLFFMAGRAYEGSWSKPSSTDTLALSIGGQPAAFAQGRIWVHIIDKAIKCSFSEK